MQRSGIFSQIKRGIVSGGRRPRCVPFGLYRNLRFHIDFSSQMQLYLGLWERETYSWIRNAVERSDWFIDVGAGAGELCSYYIARKPENFVIAIEPSASELMRLRENLSLNNSGSSPNLQINEDFAGSVSGRGCVRLDDLVANLCGPGFIKIDVDGFEVEVLAGALTLIADKTARFLVETHSKKLEDEVIGIFLDYGYSVNIIKNAWWRRIIPENRPTEHNRWIFASF